MVCPRQTGLPPYAPAHVIHRTHVIGAPNRGGAPCLPGGPGVPNGYPGRPCPIYVCPLMSPIRQTETSYRFLLPESVRDADIYGRPAGSRA